MQPFKLVTIKETGLTQRIPWDLTKANAKLQAFRAESKEMLMARDVERGRAAGADVSNGRLNVMVADVNGNLQVDPIASKIHHSGAELNDDFIPKWREFCSRPQNEPEAEYAWMEYQPKESRRANMPVTSAPGMESVSGTQRRGPGRPRKEAMGDL